MNHINIGPVETRILETAREKGGCLCVLLDPDRISSEDIGRAARAGQEGGADFLFVGSSLMLGNNFEEVVVAAKKESDLPVILFPGSSGQVTGEADALLFLSLISGRNPECLIGQHVVAAPRVHKLGLEAIPTGYMLIDSGSITSAQYMSMTPPMPRNKPDIATAHGLAAKYLGMRFLYLESGSGADMSVPEEMIEAVVQATGLPVIVGGGIRTAESARAKVEAGASCVVMGSCFEDSWDPELVREMADAVHLS